MPRESVAPTALSRILAEGLVLGATGPEEVEFEEESVEQPARGNSAAEVAINNAAVVRMKLTLPESTRDVILRPGVAG